MTENHDDSVGGNVPEELTEVFDGLRQRYREVPPPAPGAAVSAFLDVGLAQRADGLPMAAGAEPETNPTRGRRAVSSITAFIGTAVGKVVLGATVAAASVGAGQAAGVINVIPRHQAETVVHTTDDPAVHPTTTEVRDTEADEPESTEPETSEPEATEPPEVTEPTPTTAVEHPLTPVVTGHEGSEDQSSADDNQGDEADHEQGDDGDHQGDQVDDHEGDSGDQAGHDQGDEADQPESGDDGDHQGSGSTDGGHHDSGSTDGGHSGSDD
jgi:hypothetical protein